MKFSTFKYSFFIIILVLNFSCKKNVQELHNTESEIKIYLNRIHINHSENYYKGNDGKTIKWYYPFEVVFFFEIVNISDHQIVFVAKEHYYRSKGGFVFGEIRAKSGSQLYKIESNTMKYLEPSDTTSFVAYSIDLPFFEKVYTNTMLREYFQSFQEDYRFTYFPKYKNYRSIKTIDKNDSYIRVPTSIEYLEDFVFLLLYDDLQYISLDEIGYPFDTVPESVKIIEPIPGIGW